MQVEDRSPVKNHVSRATWFLKQNGVELVNNDGAGAINIKFHFDGTPDEETRISFATNLNVTKKPKLTDSSQQPTAQPPPAAKQAPAAPEQSPQQAPEQAPLKPPAALAADPSVVNPQQGLTRADAPVAPALVPAQPTEEPTAEGNATPETPPAPTTPPPSSPPPDDQQAVPQDQPPAPQDQPAAAAQPQPTSPL